MCVFTDSSVTGVTGVTGVFSSSLKFFIFYAFDYPFPVFFSGLRPV